MKKSDSQIYTYNETELNVNEEVLLSDIKPINSGVQWINFHSFENVDLVKKTFDDFGVHKLTREDILQLVERPKVEEYEDYIYITLKSAVGSSDNKMNTEQISFILTGNTVISYQERRGDMYAYVRDRIENDKGLVRKKGADYLLYLLIEATLAGYDPIIDHVDSEIDRINKELRIEHTPAAFNEIEQSKETIRDIKKAIHPFRDQISKLVQSEHSFITAKSIPFFSDIRDNVLYISDELENLKSELESLSNLYFARSSQRSNEVMQFLTIVAAIFIPLTFIAGLYGMNFQYIPELQARNGYFIVLGVMLLLALGLILYFKKRKWF